MGSSQSCFAPRLPIVRGMGIVALGTILMTAPSVSAQKSKLRALPSLNEPESASRGSQRSDRNADVPITLNAGATIPLDDGRGYPNAYGYFFTKRKAWPWPETDFQAAFAVVAADAELSWRGLLTRDTDLGFGVNYQTFGRYEEYNRGQILILERMATDTVSGRLFIHQRVHHNFAQVAELRAMYELGYTDYSRDDETITNFTLANSGIFQTARLSGGSGTYEASNYSPKGWSLSFNVEATFRDDWRRWGPPNLYDSSSEFQKFQLDGVYVLPIYKDQSLIGRFTGGVGNDLDRLAAFKLGSSLTGKPGTLVLHGFYTEEIFAEDFVLGNVDYVIPILTEQQLALHFYADGAATTRGDVPDRSVHGWAGIGSAVTFVGWWETEWQVGYGFGINAQRGTDNGGHEFFTQMSKQF